MAKYLTIQELAEQLRVETQDVVQLIEQGKLRAIRIGDKTRIAETEVEKLADTCSAAPAESNSSAREEESLPAGSRWCLTRTGRARFRVAGSLEEGCEIWVGRMPSPIRFPRSFIRRLSTRFQPGDIPVGGIFSGPGQGSLGEFIQREIKTKMNPAVYIAALLIEEGYADESSRRGYIHLRPPAFYQNQLGTTLSQET